MWCFNTVSCEINELINVHSTDTQDSKSFMSVSQINDKITKLLVFVYVSVILLSAVTLVS